ncbi:hypothetical protein QO002_004459 [Pararhizobium capsulatum DSM 1112]|uniref:VIT family protein n=1 Tax=Pararhizobium capsulatum DSM 1112 TaxID=1121113 RepID=A0ABU0BWC6_9HYPH|nr:VIT1/CCC1 transporter family protein [Pararhizobium capsulatum]MDQ0322253.1 hypothetical protein [Pararhizobium capsulatum DSM 1112]
MKEGEQTRPVLDPIDRMSEVIFGLLMALTFTGTMSASVAGGERVASVLMAALGCNIAWGIVDAVMFVLATVVERARHNSFVAAIHTLPMEDAQQVFRENLPPEARRVMADQEVDSFLVRVREQSARPAQRMIGTGDLKAACFIFALVVLSTLPPSLPFLFVDDLHRAMRISNGIALVMLFIIGAQLGTHAGRSPWPMAFAMTSIGAVMVAVTIALGG